MAFSTGQEILPYKTLIKTNIEIEQTTGTSPAPLQPTVNVESPSGRAKRLCNAVRALEGLGIKITKIKK